MKDEDVKDLLIKAEAGDHDGLLPGARKIIDRAIEKNKSPIDFILKAQQSKWDEVLQMVEDNVDVNTRGSNGETALHYAAYQGNVKVMESLLNAGADINCLNKDGTTPLLMSLSSGKGVELLLERGASVRGVNRNGSSPLHMAVCAKSSNKYIKILLEKGVDPKIKDSSRFTALDYARYLNCGKEIISLLEAASGY